VAPVSGAGEPSRNELVDWARTLHAPNGTGSQETSQSVETGAEASARTELTQVVGGLLGQRWQKYARDTLLAHGVELMNSGSVADRLGLQRDLRTLLETVRTNLETSAEHAWDLCFQAGTEAGYSLLFWNDGQTGERSRNPPPLVLTGMQYAQEVVQRILRSGVSGAEGQREYLTSIAKLKTKHANQSVYYLVHSYLFGNNGYWRVASILARRTQLLLDRSPNSSGASAARDTNVLRREAAYLRAVALRRAARGLPDIVLAKTLLSVAADAAKYPGSGVALESACTFRFEAEGISCDVTAHHFRVLLNATVDFNVNDLPTAEANAIALLEKLKDESKLDEISVKIAIETQTMINIVLIQILRTMEFHLANPNASPADLWNMLTRGVLVLQEFEEALERYTYEISARSFFMRVIHLFLKIASAKTREQARDDLQILNDALSVENLSRTRVFFYDTQRYGCLRSIVQKLLII